MVYTVTTGWARPIAGAAKEGDIEIMEIQVAAVGGSPRPEPGLDLVPASDVSTERAHIRKAERATIKAREAALAERAAICRFLRNLNPRYAWYGNILADAIRQNVHDGTSSPSTTSST